MNHIMDSSHVNTSPGFARRLLSVAVVAAGQLIATAPAMAAPDGGNIVAGVGSITSEGVHTTVTQRSDRLIAEWQRFDLAEGERVSYVQPGREAIALNRILSHSASDIRGRIEANGHVILVNPQGIVFGENAQVNVGGMIASGLDISNDDFLANNLTFSSVTGTDGLVVNRGLINAATGGSVVLMGQRVENTGLISAQLGAVTLASGQETVMTFDDAGLIGVRVMKSQLQGSEENPAVMNTGRIEAAGGQVLLTASQSQDIFSQAVNAGEMGDVSSVVVHDDGSFTLGEGGDVSNGGEISVSSATGAGGRVALLGENVTHTGNVLASATEGDAGVVELHSRDTTLLLEDARIETRSERASGGDILLLGDRVGLSGETAIEASGGIGGGRVLIGGGYDGQNSSIRHSRGTYVGPEVSITANAETQGDGGEIIVWSDLGNRFYGNIQAYGGDNGGSGGIAAVAGKEWLVFRGAADVSAGEEAGTLQLNAGDISVGDRVPGSEFPGSRDVDFSDDRNEVTVDRDSLVDHLNTGGHLILNALRDVRVEATLYTHADNEHSLTLSAGDDIVVARDHVLNVGRGEVHFFSGSMLALDGCDVSASGCLQGAPAGAEELTGRSILIEQGAGIITEGAVELLSAGQILANGFIGTPGSGPRSLTVKSRYQTTVNGDVTLSESEASGAGSPETRLVMSAGDDSLEDRVGVLEEDPVAGLDHHLILNADVNTRGGTVQLDTPGAMLVRRNVATSGGDIRVGEATAPAFFASFMSPDLASDLDAESLGLENHWLSPFNGTLNTGTADVEGGRYAGSIVVNTAAGGDIHLGDLSLQMNARSLDALVNGQIPSSFDTDQSWGAERVGSISIKSGGSATLHSDWNYNDSGAFAANGTRDGGWLNAPALNIEAADDILLKGAVYDAHADGRDLLDINLRAGGAVILEQDLFTAGGNLSVAAEHFSMSGWIDTRHANLDDNGEERNGGGAWAGNSGFDAPEAFGAFVSSGGNVDLTLTGDRAVAIGRITTLGQCEVARSDCAGNLTIRKSSEQNLHSISQSAGSALNVGGVTTIDIGESSVYLDSSDNQWSGGVKITGAHDVALAQNGSLNFLASAIGGDLVVSAREGITSTGALNVSGSSQLTSGGAIALLDAENTFSGTMEIANAGSANIASRGALVLGAVTTTASDSHSGDISLASDTTITLTDDIKATAANSADRGGDITLQGDVVIGAAEIEISSEHANNGAGSLTVSGRLAADNPETALNLHAGTTRFGQTIGTRETSDFLDLIIHSYGDVSFDGSIAPWANRIQVNALGREEQTLSLTNTVNAWSLVGEADGTIGFNASANRYFSFSGFDKLVGGNDRDTFIVSGDTLRFSGVIDGAGGSNDSLSILNVSDGVIVGLEDARGADVSVRNIEQLVGNHHPDTALKGPQDGRYVWRLNALNAGSTRSESSDPFSVNMAFAGVSNLVSDGSDNTFAFVGGKLTGQVVGSASGDDWLDFSGAGASICIGLLGANCAGSAFLTVDDVSLFSGMTGADGYDSLLQVGGNDDYHWRFQALTGSLRTEGVNDGIFDVGNLNMPFINFNQIESGSGNDRFELTGDARVTGYLDAGAGENRLDASQSLRAWHFDLSSPREHVTDALILKGVNTIQANVDFSHRLIAPDSDNEWRITHRNAGTLNGSELAFSGIDTLIGGSGSDDFVLNEGGRVSRIDGGGATSENRILLDNVNDSVWLSLDSGSTGADIRITDIGEILAASGVGHRLEGAKRNNQWLVTGADAGVLNGALSFSGMEALLGNSADDTYIFGREGQITGYVDGNGGRDRVDLLAIPTERQWRVATTANLSADLIMLNMESLVASVTADHILLAGDERNEWQVTGSNQGALNGLNFSGVGYLLGGRRDDHFLFTPSGSLSGYLDGGAGAGFDTVDLSSLVAVDVTTGSTQGDVRHINRLLGNHTQTRLTALDDNNVWLLGEGKNRGTLNQRLEFTGITDIAGGDGGNQFYLQGGWVTGDIQGGAGSDWFEVQIDGGMNIDQRLSGGDGEDSLWVTGGGSGYEAFYQAGAEDNVEFLEYLAPGSGDADAYRLSLEGITEVRDEVVADRLTLQSGTADDRLILQDQAFEFEGWSAVSYRHKTDLAVEAITGNHILLASPLTLSGDLSIRNGQVHSVTRDTALNVGHLQLKHVERFGSPDQWVQVQVEQLTASVLQDGLYMSNRGDLLIHAMDSAGGMGLKSSGSITSGADWTVTDSAILQSERGAIDLRGNNRFDGTVHLSANDSVALRHRSNLVLGDVGVASLSLIGNGSIVGEGALQTDHLLLDIDGAFHASERGNRLGSVTISAAGEVDFYSGRRLIVEAFSSGGNAAVRAEQLSLDGPVNSLGTLQLESATDLEQRGNIHAEGDIRSSAGGRLVMADGALTRSIHGDIVYGAAEDMSIASLVSDHRVALETGGAVRTAGVSREEPHHVQADRLEMRAGRGIGVNQRLATAVTELYATNETGDMAINNLGPLTIERLANNGNISLGNSGTVWLDGGDLPAFDSSVGDAVAAGGTASANYHQGVINITIADGDLLGAGPADSLRPDLVGRNGSLIVGGDIGSVVRPLVMHFKDSVLIQGLRSWPPLWGLGTQPEVVDNQSVFQLNQQDLSRAGEQMVEVESLEDIDPAIFTEVRNYAYDDVSILMPPDQRYDSDEDAQYSLSH